MKCSRKRLAILICLIITKPLLGKMIQNLEKISMFGLAVPHKGCVVGFHGCTSIQFLLWQKSWRIVELRSYQGSLKDKVTITVWVKALCNLCMGKKWVFLWTVTLLRNIKQDFCNACYNDLWRSFHSFQTNGGIWGHSDKEIFLTVYAILLCNSSKKVVV